MAKPTILQTLLREPSRSYSQSTASSSSYDLSPNSSRRGTSLCSSSSFTSARSDSQPHLVLNEPVPDGRSWEWATFGGRRGLTGGPASLRVPSVIFDGSDSGSLRGTRSVASDDGRSLRSFRSAGSVQSAAADMRSDHRSRSTSAQLERPTELKATKKSKPSKLGTSRRYSDGSVSLPPPLPVALSRASGGPSPAPSTLPTSSPSPSHSPAPSTTGSDSGSTPRKKKKKRPFVESPSTVEFAAPLSLVSSGASTAPPSRTPISLMHHSDSDPLPLDGMFAAERKDVGEARLRPRRSFALERVDEVLEEEMALEVRRRSFSSPSPPKIEFPEGKDIEHGSRAGSDGEALSSKTLHHLDAFASTGATLVHPLTEKKSTDHVPFVPVVGRVYTVDELFGSIPTAPRPSTTAISAITTMLPAPPDDATLPADTVDVQGLAPHSPRTQDALLPLQPAVRRPTVDMTLPSTASSDVSSAPSSSLCSATDVSSPATDVSMGEFAQPRITAETLPVAPEKESPGVPRIRLTRTESDQAVAGMVGDVEMVPLDDSQAPPERPPMSEERLRRRESEPAAPTLEIIASSTQPTPATGAISAPHTSAYVVPRWAKRSQGLREQSVSLITTSPRRSVSLSTVSEMERNAIAAVRASAAHARSNSIDVRPTVSTAPPRSYSLRSQSSQAPPSALSSRPTSPQTPNLVEQSLFDSRSPSRRTSSTHDTPSSPSVPSSQLSFAASANLVVPVAPPLPGPAPLPHPPGELFAAAPHVPPLADSSRRAASVFSDTPSVGDSETGRSVMSAPVYRMPATKRLSIGAMTLYPSSKTMNALSICTSTPTKSGFSLFHRASKEGPGPNHKFQANRDLTFGPLRPPPTKLHSSEVLVSVLAVGIDLWDREHTCTQAGKREGFGFIPGRSFCGRVVECGIEVSRVKRGDLVYGLNELRKSGALAQLMTIHRDFLAVAPNCGLMLEQIASLPFAGVPAVQVMEPICRALPKGSKILILDAATGCGNMCLQLAAYFRKTRDLWIVAQCEDDVPDGAAYCRATGASDVIVDEPLAALNSLHESSFDVVVDTLGGRRLYDASRRVLHFQGAFVSTVGDELSVPNSSKQLQTGIRSLRRSFFKKDKKVITYSNVNLDPREYVRETLDKLRSAVEQTSVRPSLRRILNFEDAGLAFEEDIRASTAVRVG